MGMTRTAVSAHTVFWWVRIILNVLLNPGLNEREDATVLWLWDASCIQHVHPWFKRWYSSLPSLVITACKKDHGKYLNSRFFSILRLNVSFVTVYYNITGRDLFFCVLVGTRLQLWQVSSLSKPARWAVLGYSQQGIYTQIIFVFRSWEILAYR